MVGGETLVNNKWGQVLPFALEKNKSKGSESIEIMMLNFWSVYLL